MTDNVLKIPSYAKATIFLVGFFAFLAMLYIAQGIIVPLVFAVIISILLQPVVDFFTGKKINRVIAILITIFITFLVIAGFGVLLFSQISQFSESWPILVERFTGLLNDAVIWASGYFDINQQEINSWITENQGEILNANTAAIGQTLVTVGGWLIVLFLVPVYVFLILFYQPLLLDFVCRIFGKNNHSKVREITSKTKTVIQRYLVGLLIEIAIIATLETATLFILGIDYAIMLGIIGALLNLIPYVGGLVAVALPMMVALVTKTNAWYAFWVLVIYYIIQLVDNNFIVPKIVASKVKINALFSIIAILVGNALWGIAGMFLSIPLLAIVKLIFDHIESLKPWGSLLGDTMPPMLKITPIIKKLITSAT